MISPKRLGELLAGNSDREKLQQGWSPQCERRAAEADEWGVLKTTAIQPGAFLDNENKALPPELSERPALEVTTGDMLLTCAGPRARCGVPTLVRSTRERLMISGKMYRFRPTTSVDPRYLEAYLLSPDAQSRIDGMKTGISDSGLNLTKERFLALPVPVPPLDEQRRIVDILDDHLSRLDAADAQLAIARSRLASLLNSGLDCLIWQSGLPTTTVDQVLKEPMRNGHSARASGDALGIRTLTLTAVTRGIFTDEFTKITTAEPTRVADLWLRPGDVLVQRSNTPELVGTTALYEGPDNWAIFPDLLIRLRADPTRVSPEFLALSLQSQRCHRALRARAKGLAGSMPKVDQRAIGATVLPLPSIEEQRRITESAEELRSTTALLTESIDQSRRRSSSLRRALLAAAFSGRLIGHSSDLDIAEELMPA